MTEETNADLMENVSHEGVEPEGLPVKAIGAIIVGGLVFIIAAMFVVVAVTDLVFHDAVVESATVTGYPALQDTREHAESLLSDYAPIDRDAGIYRIPIDRAMEIVAREAAETQNSGR